ncbi:MAG: hypothetical protein GY827_03330 [Cytophagales bacterium]|nr:hypothetical protein [Cytophagales bacterium]
MRYTGTSIEDLAGRKLASTSTLSSIDRATPRMETIEIFDTDVNGKLDTIEITYSENLNSSTSTTGLTLNNPLS